MAYVTINSLHEELKRVRKEIRDLRGSPIPVEKISREEHAELDEIEAEMRAGKATPWRQVAKR